MSSQGCEDGHPPPGQAERPQDGEVTAAAAAGHHDELPEHGQAENGEHDRECRRGAVDPDVVGGTVRTLVGNHTPRLQHAPADGGHGPLEGGDLGRPPGARRETQHHEP